MPLIASLPLRTVICAPSITYGSENRYLALRASVIVIWLEMVSMRPVSSRPSKPEKFAVTNSTL
ncbi:Uncharacterised protein [Vibrio cholerae]|uniref:Uncharacterized protein n=1 Tax=Vibrio cholerae TaxID=666 RepID=A0A656A6C7_VIBCL|nr:Uncharacterised protein [Vibrio cholerae]